MVIKYSTCDWCGAEFTDTGVWAWPRHFCSNKCRVEYKKNGGKGGARGGGHNRIKRLAYMTMIAVFAYLIIKNIL